MGDTLICIADTSSIGSLIGYIICIIARYVIPLLMTLALVAFMWGAVQFILNAEDSQKREEGKSFLVWGIIALFVMVSVWGLVAIISNTFSIPFVIPQLPTS